jgi:hypothetical protein
MTVPGMPVVDEESGKATAAASGRLRFRQHFEVVR